MPLKAVIFTATVPAKTTTLGLLDTQGNTSITKTSKQLVKWYKNIIT